MPQFPLAYGQEHPCSPLLGASGGLLVAGVSTGGSAAFHPQQVDFSSIPGEKLEDAFWASANLRLRDPRSCLPPPPALCGATSPGPEFVAPPRLPLHIPQPPGLGPCCILTRINSAPPCPVPNQGTLSPEYHWHPPQEVRAPCSHAPAFTPLPNYLPGGCWRAAGATSIRAHARSTGQRCVTARGCSLGAPHPIPPGCPQPQCQAPALRGHLMPPWPPGRAGELPNIQLCISKR